MSDPAHSSKGFRLYTGRMENTGRLFLGQGSPETRGALCRPLSRQAAGEGRLPRLRAEYFAVWRHAALWVVGAQPMTGWVQALWSPAHMHLRGSKDRQGQAKHSNRSVRLWGAIVLTLAWK